MSSLSPYSPQDKLRVVSDAARLNDSELGEFLRRAGIHEDDLARWREEALGGLGGTRKGQPPSKRIRELERELRRKEKALAEAAALLVLAKKARSLWGGRGRRHERGVRQELMMLVDEAIGAGAKSESACDVLGISTRSIERWRADEVGDDQRHGPTELPEHALTAQEREHMVELANTPEYRDLPPEQVPADHLISLDGSDRSSHARLNQQLSSFFAALVRIQVDGAVRRTTNCLELLAKRLLENVCDCGGACRTAVFHGYLEFDHVSKIARGLIALTSRPDARAAGAISSATAPAVARSQL